MSGILNKSYLKLVLQISLSEVSYCIHNTLTNSIDKVEKTKLDHTLNFIEVEKFIIQFIKENQDLQQSFDDVLVLYNNNLNTFVPQVLFDENYLSSYLQYNVKVFESDFIVFDEISTYEMNNVYIPYVNINNALIDIYGNFNYKHASSVLVKKLLDNSKNIEETQMFVNCEPFHFQIIVVRNQKLLFFNSFDYKTKEDFIYYILFTAEQLQLNPEYFQLKLMGDISETSDLYQMVYKYIRNVSLVTNENSHFVLHSSTYTENFTVINGCE